MNKIAINRIASITAMIDNSADSLRKYDVRASVTVIGGQARDICSGAVLRMDATDEHPASIVAGFCAASPGQKSITFNAQLTAAEEREITAAITDFLTAVDTAAADMNITALI